MKTAIRTIFCAVAVVMVAVSCQKSIEPANPAEEGKGTIDISVNGLMGEYAQQDGVKSSLVNNVRVAWAAGDVVYVFDGSNYLGKLTAALDKKADGLTDEDRYAKLGGTISAPATTPCVLSLVHSSLMMEPAAGAAVSELSIDMSAQSTATVPFVAYATLEYTGTTITDVVVPFQFATSVIKVNCTGLKPGTAITSATLNNVNTKCKLTLSGSAAPTVSGSTNGTITRIGDEYFAAAKINAEGEAVFQIAVPALETTSGARILTVAQGSDEVKDKHFSKKAIDPATSVNTVCQLVELPAGALKCEFTVSDDDGATTKQIYFSQGNLTYNVSTTTWAFYEHQYDCATDYDSNLISLFTWGYDATKSIDPDGISYVEGHKTNGESFNKNEDWGYVFGGESSVWRTLTTAEWQYLFNTRTASTVNGTANARYAKATVNSIAGIILLPDTYTHPEGVSALTSINTASAAFTANTYDSANWAKIESAGAVFLPAAGYRSGSDVGIVGDLGCYWSSTAYDSVTAYSVTFAGAGVYPASGDNRRGGVSVRLITE